jgi:[protein-PII] uridylyltransferase
MLEEIIYSNKNDFEILKEIKKEIKNYQENLETEASGKQFFIKYTKKMDEFITITFKFVLKKMFGYYRPNINSLPITLTAMGSYGRVQLSLCSDIDIMIVYREIEGYNTKEIIETFITMLWDLGLQIGHRVHKIEELLPVSKTDIMIKTAILESRYIYGSKHLWVEIQNELKKIRLDNQKEFVLARYQKMQEYHKKYPLSMEPNIKKGFGGMRDANTLFWIANVLYGISNNAELIGIVFDENDYKEYRNALEFLFKTRTYLHMITKNHKDVVLLDYQREIALNMGYIDKKRIPSEQQFIKDLLKSLWTINRFASIYIKKLLKPFLFDSKNISKIKRIDKNYYICDEKLYTNWHTKDKMKETISVLLKQNFKHYDVSLVNLFYHQKADITKTQLKQLFAKKHLYPIIKALYKAGKLQNIIPDFKKVEYLAQFDGYHQYPVDIHSIKTLYELENITYKNIKAVYNSLDAKYKYLLKIVALFHDLGKGRVSDHHIVGEKIIENFLRNLNTKEEDIFIAKRLVRYHTKMSNIAQREDIDNDKVLLNFANIVQKKLILDMLYVLTYADISAVSDGLFNSFKANLLYRLYQNTLEILENEELVLSNTKRARKEKMLLKNETFLSLPKTLQKDILNSPSTQLFLKNSVEKIINIATKINTKKDLKYSISTLNPLTIEIIKKDKNFDLGYFLYKLSYLPLRHISIYKIGQYKYFQIVFETIATKEDKLFIFDLIKECYGKKNTLFEYPEIKWEEWKLNCSHSKNYLSLKLQTKDKKGIIASIMSIFDKYNIDVEDIKISVQKKIVRDIFIIHKDSGLCQTIKHLKKEFK